MTRATLAYCSIATLLGGLIAGLLSLLSIHAGWESRLPAVAMSFMLVGYPVNLLVMKLCLSRSPRRGVERGQAAQIDAVS